MTAPRRPPGSPQRATSPDQARSAPQRRPPRTGRHRDPAKPPITRDRPLSRIVAIRDRRPEAPKGAKSAGCFRASGSSWPLLARSGHPTCGLQPDVGIMHLTGPHRGSPQRRVLSRNAAIDSRYPPRRTSHRRPSKRATHRASRHRARKGRSSGTKMSSYVNSSPSPAGESEVTRSGGQSP